MKRNSRRWRDARDAIFFNRKDRKECAENRKGIQNDVKIFKPTTSAALSVFSALCGKNLHGKRKLIRKVRFFFTTEDPEKH